MRRFIQRAVRAASDSLKLPTHAELFNSMRQKQIVSGANDFSSGAAKIVFPGTTRQNSSGATKEAGYLAMGVVRGWSKIEAVGCITFYELSVSDFEEGI
ncbi:hypothetical protein NDU88_006462 [Pleurodeles waltl]|uniref:Uncharacterized protein n=1 Tax=Pleurodeles waltl TaxID=8319 RepID=A0AAV7UN22_PLEWA|nr:hypothetical protein NDU88_006462 [Pleurodeles waltl]